MFKMTIKFLATIKYDFKSIVSGWLAFMAIAPVLASLAIFWSMPADLLTHDSPSPVSMAVVSDNGRLINVMIFNALRPITLIGNIERVQDIEIALDMLNEGEVSTVIKIPTGIVDALIYNTPVEIEIWSNIEEPATNVVLLDFADNVASAITSAQSAIYVYFDVAAPYFDDRGDFNEAYNALASAIFREVLQRGRSITIEQHLYDFAVQIISVIIFMTGAVAAALISINSAVQLSNGSYVRMKLNGLGFRTYRFSKLCETILVSVCLSIPIMLVGNAFIQDSLIRFDMIRLLICVIIVSIVFFGISTVIAALCGNPHWTAMGTFSAMLILMFAGGAFYPLHLFGGIIQTIGVYTPAYKNMEAIMWASGGAFPYVWLLIATVAALLPFTKEGAVHV